MNVAATHEGFDAGQTVGFMSINKHVTPTAATTCCDFPKWEKVSGLGKL